MASELSASKICLLHARGGVSIEKIFASEREKVFSTPVEVFLLIKA